MFPLLSLTTKASGSESNGMYGSVCLIRTSVRSLTWAGFPSSGIVVIPYETLTGAHIFVQGAGMTMGE
jgi:hypothetical protein